MFYRIRYLLATTLIVYIGFPSHPTFSQSKLTNFEIKDIYQQKSLVFLPQQASQLYEKGENYYKQYKYQEALDKFQQALPILQQIGDTARETKTLNYIGQIYINLKQYSQAAKYLEQASIVNSSPKSGILYTGAGIANTLPTKTSTSTPPTINKDGICNSLEGKFFHTLIAQSAPIPQLLPILFTPSNICDGSTNTSIGMDESLPRNLPEPSNIVVRGQSRLPIGEGIPSNPQLPTQNKKLNGVILNNLGLAYLYQGKFDKAEKSINQAIDLFQKINNKIEQGKALNNLGELYRHRSQYPKALKYLEQAKEIFQTNQNQAGIATSYNNIGLVHDELGQHHQALKHYHKSLKIRQKFKDQRGIGTSLHNIGFANDQLGKYDEALKFYQQALKVHHNTKYQEAQGTTLNNMGLVYNKLGQNTLALQSLKKSLYIFQKIDYPRSEANTLDSLGTIYKSQGKYEQAHETYHKALAISRRIGDRTLERIILSNIGDLLAKQKQTELAIIFYKQSVKITEEIRKGLQTLPQEQQKSYTKTVADTYRNLADLLLKQEGVQEAQQVLDLLKVQELEEYLHNTQKTKAQRLGEYIQNQGVNKGNLTILPPEQKILQKYNQQSKTAIEIGQELYRLRTIAKNQRTPAQRERITKLILLQQDLNKQFNKFAQQEDIVELLEQLTPEARKQILDMKSLDALRDDLRRLNAVIVYPLILDDRLELVITTPDSPPLHRTVQITSSELNQEIIKFRKALQNRHSNVKISANRLYNLLIKPLEIDLNQSDPKTIIYAPDGQLRYIPLAALHDGNQWLIERYQINNITAKSLTDFTAKPKPLEKVLAGAFVKGQYKIEIGERSFPFAGLPFTAKEVENLATIKPQTKKLIDEEFSKNAIISSMNEYDILHFATHAAFVPDDATQSFILFGNGEKATFEDIGSWTLNNVDLVVLSACETGLGGQFGNGEEILGLGYQFENRGVRATVASLWQVSDGGTKTLMNAFYGALKGNVTKAEALRQAQIKLIQDNGSAPGVKNRSIFQSELVDRKQTRQITRKLEHPYYWAPFILIGNGL